MVRRKKIPSALEDHQNGMTVKPGDGSGDEGAKKAGRKLEGGEEEESAEPGSDESNTKRDGEEDLHPSSAGPCRSAPVPASSSSSAPGPDLHPQNQDQHHFLRSSVRPPSKRLRKESLASAVNGHSGAKGKGAENGAAVLVGCGPSGSPVSSGNATSKTAPRSLGPSDKEEGSQKKARRQWESWSAEDKNSFFEGLYEHGKDFEAIQNNIALKYKKKGKPASMVKNKEQVRHFYYRTWHKISKYIDFTNVYSRGLKKSSQELYGLICYAELRKKVGGCMDDKNAAKLNELIQHGATTVRSKGRNLRIKAPMCRALKKLCDPDGVSDEEDQKPVRLPLKVPVELQPRSNHSWARVQSLAHNPRLRMVVELHRKVSSLIEFLKQKWAVQDHRIRKSLEERQALDGPQCSPSGEAREELFLYPSESSTLTALPGVARVVHSKAFCTVHWLESGKCRPGTKELPPAQMLGIQTAHRGTGRQGRTVGEPRRGESLAAEGTDDMPGGAEEKSQNPGQNPPPGPEGEGLREGEPLHQEEQAAPGEGMCKEDALSQERLGEPADVAMDTEEHPMSEPFPAAEGPGLDLVIPGDCICPMEHLSPRKAQMDALGDGVAAVPMTCGDERGVVAMPLEPGPPEGAVPMEPAPGEVCTKEDEAAEAGSPEARVAKEDGGRPPRQIREEGWSTRSTENVTLAELYLMLGKPDKLQLEYEWLPVSKEDGRPHANPHGHNTHRVLRCLLRLVSSEVNPKPAPELCSTATSPIKSFPEDQSLTPPGKILSVGVRSPSCGRSQAATRGGKLLSPTASSQGVRNLPRSLIIPGVGGSGPGETDSGLFAIPTTLPPNSRHGKMFSPNKEAELAFRQQLDSISMQSDIFLPKQRKFRNRHLRKPLVVQRTLLPRTAGDASQHVCSFSILSNSSVAGTGSFRPIQSPLSAATGSRPIISKVIPSSNSSQLSSTIDLAAKSAGIIPGSPARVMEAPSPGPLTESSVMSPDPVPMSADKEILDQNTDGMSPPEALLRNGAPPSPSETPASLLSPPNMSSLLDISLPGPPEEVLSQGEQATQISDSIIELAINSAHYGDGSSLSPAKLNGSDSSKSLPSPASSPQRNWIASPTHDPQWYPSDSTDSSLGCLLSSLISPEKGRKMLLTSTGPSSGTSLLGPSLLDGSSRDSFASRSLADVGEVDSQLVCMMSENSVDYIARFNDLAQELSVTEPPPPPPPAPSSQGGPG
ncbi:protein cramped-like isoform X2 [Amia ocellicauda]|uniref:protein cramped-like isoform X2 n=1 Tax=Amia ocellicauda TaxID=2972642 RepID=UPI003464E259